MLIIFFREFDESRTGDAVHVARVDVSIPKVLGSIMGVDFHFFGRKYFR